MDSIRAPTSATLKKCGRGARATSTSVRNSLGTGSAGRKGQLRRNRRNGSPRGGWWARPTPAHCHSTRRAGWSAIGKWPKPSCPFLPPQSFMDLFELTRALIDIDSVTPNEEAVGVYLAAYLGELAALTGGKVERIKVEANRFNILAHW